MQLLLWTVSFRFPLSFPFLAKYHVEEFLVFHFIVSSSTLQRFLFYFPLFHNIILKFGWDWYFIICFLNAITSIFHCKMIFSGKGLVVSEWSNVVLWLLYVSGMLLRLSEITSIWEQEFVQMEQLESKYFPVSFLICFQAF